jgi:hypothetical protein
VCRTLASGKTLGPCQAARSQALADPGALLLLASVAKTICGHCGPATSLPLPLTPDPEP